MAAFFALMLSACGGGSGFTADDDDDTPPPAADQVADLRLLADPSSLFDDADTSAEGVTISAIATNEDGITVPTVPVAFALVAPDNDATLTVTSGTTNDSGVATATLTTGGNSSPRNIRLRATVTTSSGTVTAAITVPVVRRLNSISLTISSPQLQSNADTAPAGVTVTAVVRDANQNVVPNAAVTFSTTSTANIIAANPVITDENGRATAVVTTGGDPTNRVVTIVGRVGSVDDDIDIEVVGTSLTLDGPTNTQIGVDTAYVATLGNGSGGIAGVPVDFSTNAGNTLSAASVTTNASGQAIVTLTPTVPNTTLRAAALGLNASVKVKVSTDEFRFIKPKIVAPDTSANVDINKPIPVSVRWRQAGVPVPDGTVVNFATTRGTLNKSRDQTINGVATVTISSSQAGLATISASSNQLSKPNASIDIQFISTTAFAVSLSANPAVVRTGRTSEISATVVDAADNVVAGKTVEFNLTDSTGGTLSSPTAITDGFGQARITYTPGAVPSQQNGVVVRSVVRNADGSTVSATTRLTVTDGALRLSLQTGNELFEPNETTYKLPYTAIVTDGALNPVPTAEIQLSAFATDFFKGYYGVDPLGNVGTVTTAACENEDVDRDGRLDTEDANGNGTLDPGEDLDGDGVLDTEDTNGNGRLDPGNVASVPRSPPLGEDGTVQFDITYGQDRGNWIKLELTGRAAVEGSEDREVATFILRIVESDAPNPPGTAYDEAEVGIDANADGDFNDRFVGSPYGISGTCTDSN